MPRITKGMIQAAYAALDGIHELATDPEAYGGKNATYQYHANSANNYLAVLVKSGNPIPVWISTSGEKYFRAMGWKW